ncbi:MAG: SRPBCC domain-containing protein [Pseudomonadota bacterium]
MSSWFGPGDTQRVDSAELDVREGGSYHVRFFTEDGQDHDVAGVYQEVVLHRKLSFTWAWKSTPDRVSLVTIALRPVDGGTELDFVHERFFDRQACDNHARGWTASFAKLGAQLAG